MELISLAVKQALLGFTAVVRGLWILPAVICLSIFNGNLFSWASMAFTGSYLQTDGLAVYDSEIPGDKIHFLRTGGSDAILLESNGLFAMVDAAEDSDNLKNDPSLRLDGWEEYVLDYVKRAAGDAQGKVTLEFVLGTHSHSDHIGGFDTLILDPDVTVKKAFLKRYDNENMLSYEQEWDNQEVYDQMVSALELRGVPLIQDIPAESFSFGNFTVTIFNGEYNNTTGDENESSLGVLVESGGNRAFLAGDINNFGKTEDRISKVIGKVDLLKAGHHGHPGSSTLPFVYRLNPDAVIFTAYGENVNGLVLNTFAIAANPAMMSTGDFGGVAAVFSGGKINYYAINEFAVPLESK
ncbi:MAG: MBL fold metallo-hydrolase [Oscillospiraceae bacterium]|nr:MBL fold metallo-hydrolase [Oscillospiraceae bacterium]